jgi:voltage-gated potassium channel
MKFLPSQLAYLLSQPEGRQNVRALGKYLLFLLAVITFHSITFHLIKQNVEGEYYSWLTGFYWTLVVMTTLGFGDIVFTSEIGRAFSLVVLLSGIVLLLVMLPFTFIRFFYAPWLEAQVRLRAPRRVPESTRDHVIITSYDPIARGLIQRLRLHAVPFFVLEPNPQLAAHMHGEGISVVAGELDSDATYTASRAAAARLVLANCDDTTNTNITLTVREVAPDVPIVAVVEEKDSIDVLELSGCTHVLPLKQRLGEYLASRVSAGHAAAHIVGRFRDLNIAELPVRHTPLAGRTVRETELRRTTGVNIVGIWERGRLLPADPGTRLHDSSVIVVAGTAEQIGALDRGLVKYDKNDHPVLVIGAGNVGCAAARVLKQKGIPVHLIERDPALRERLGDLAGDLFVGDAADRRVLEQAGLARAPSVLLSTNDDAMNIYLAVYCRRLNPTLRIISRITHERNLEAIHRAGADFVLSYTSLGVQAVFSLLQGHELLLLGEGIDLFYIRLPRSLAGKTLAETGIGARTGLTAVALQRGGQLITNPPASHRLEADTELVVLGSASQRETFDREFR